MCIPMCANSLALEKHLRAVESGEEAWERAQNDLYERISDIIDDLQKELQFHVRFNDAGMDYKDSRDYVLETIGELL